MEPEIIDSLSSDFYTLNAVCALLMALMVWFLIFKAEYAEDAIRRFNELTRRLIGRRAAARGSVAPRVRR